MILEKIILCEGPLKNVKTLSGSYSDLGLSKKVKKRTVIKISLYCPFNC